MKRTLTIMILIALLMGAYAIPALAVEGPLEPLVPPPSAETGEMIDETPSLWFVEFNNPPTVDGGSLRFTQRDKANFRAAAQTAGLSYTERYAFDKLWNGISIEINPADLAKLARIPGVAALYPVVPVSLPEPATDSSPELYTAIQMTGADIAQSELGFTGAGVKVAVMDTGIDYDHPDLGGCFGEGCRVAYGWDLVGDDFSAGVNDTRVPDPDPDDCAGHGTHVAGIVGANGTVVGVAPGVTFGAYRVFGCSGSTWADIMIEAMEMALADDMDILNMSIGSAYTWPQYPTATASDRLVNAGMVVVASIGNSGANGLYSAGAPGLGKKVIGVASFNNTHNTFPVFEVNGTDIGYNPMAYSGPVPTSGTHEIVYVGQACNVDLPLLADPSGKVALINRGVCSFNEKATNAINAGAIAVVIHNNAPGNFSGTLGEQIGDGSIPVVSISLEDGLFIRAQASPVFMTWTDKVAVFFDPSGGLIASSSSYGLAPDLSLKPDIGAPGGNIYSTYPLELGGYATLGGTSMASPHVAGAAALLLQAKPNTPSQVVRDILQNSADPKLWSLAPGYGLLDHVHRQGAGLVDIDDAILATTKITPGKIAAGEGEAGPYTQMLTVENKGDMDVTYDMSYVNALSTGGVIAPSFWLSDASVEFNKSSFTIGAGSTATVTATIYPATYPTFGQYGGYIVFSPQGDGQVYRVPFAGFVGDYQGITVLEPTAYGFPALGWTPNGVNFGFAAEGDVFTMQGFDIPYFLVHFEHQPRMFRIEVFDASNDKAWHRAYDEEYWGRSSSPTSFFALPFDGTTVAGKKTYEVPDGEYYVVLSVLKALGDDENPDHWETWTSPNFVIDRP